MTTEPDRRLTIRALDETYYIDLWQGWRWSTIRVWRNVWPALGGTIAETHVRRRDGITEWETVCARTKTILDDAEVSLGRQPAVVVEGVTLEQAVAVFQPKDQP